MRPLWGDRACIAIPMHGPAVAARKEGRVIHPSEWFRVAPEHPRCRWLIQHRLLFAFTPRTDWRLQIGVSHDIAGTVLVLSVLCLHVGWYSWDRARRGG